MGLSLKQNLVANLVEEHERERVTRKPAQQKVVRDKARMGNTNQVLPTLSSSNVDPIRLKAHFEPSRSLEDKSSKTIKVKVRIPYAIYSLLKQNARELKYIAPRKYHEPSVSQLVCRSLTTFLNTNSCAQRPMVGIQNTQSTNILMSEDLYAALRTKSNQENVSINTLVVSALSNTYKTSEA